MHIAMQCNHKPAFVHGQSIDSELDTSLFQKACFSHTFPSSSGGAGKHFKGYTWKNLVYFFSSSLHWLVTELQTAFCILYSKGCQEIRSVLRQSRNSPPPTWDTITRPARGGGELAPPSYQWEAEPLQPLLALCFILYIYRASLFFSPFPGLGAVASDLFLKLIRLQ